MSTPALSDLILYTNTPLTDTDYTFNWQKCVNYLTDGTADFSINSLRTTAGIVCGTTIAMGGALTGVTAITASGNIGASTFTGNGSALTGIAASSTFMGYFAKTTTTASGDQSFTGVGFTPKMIVFFMSDTGCISQGMDSITQQHCSYARTGGAVGYDNSNSIFYYNGTDSYKGKIKSFDADGFTISWVRTNSPAATINVMYLAIG